MAGGALALAAGTAVLIALVVLIIALDSSASSPPHRHEHRHRPQRRSAPAVAPQDAAFAALRMADTGAPSPLQCPLLSDGGVFVAAHQHRAAALEHRARQRGRALTWAVHSHTPRPGGRVVLRNSDFAGGTLRLRVPGVYELHEDVTFEPQPPAPLRTANGTGPYDDDAYTLGFFAALTVEAPDIVIDLRNHTLQQGRMHAAVHQRFFALIELAAAPFITGQVGGVPPPKPPALLSMFAA